MGHGMHVDPLVSLFGDDMVVHMSHCIIAVPHLLVTALYSFSIVFWSDQTLDFPADKLDKRFHARAFCNPQQFPVGKKDLPVISPVDEEGTWQVDC